MYRRAVQVRFLQSLRLFSCPAPALPERYYTNWNYGPFLLPKPLLLPDCLLPSCPPVQELLLVALQPPIHLFQCNDGETRSPLWQVSLTLQASNAHGCWPHYAQSFKGSMRLEASMVPHQGWDTDLPIQHNFLGWAMSSPQQWVSPRAGVEGRWADPLVPPSVSILFLVPSLQLRQLDKELGWWPLPRG